jgi:hypothetical protein
MKQATSLVLCLLLAACGAKWPDYAGVMGAPQPQQPPAQSLTQSSR